MKNLLSILTVMFISHSILLAHPISETTTSKKKKKTDDQCVINTKNEILKELMNFEVIKRQFEISTRREKNIKVFQNNYFDHTTDVSINFEKVMIVNNPSRYPDALVIDFPAIDCDTNSAEFSISSRTKNLRMTGGLRMKDGVWEIQIFSQQAL